MNAPALRVAVTIGALRVPPTYFAFSHARHLPAIDFRYFTAFAEVRETAPWPITTPPLGRYGWPLLGRSIKAFAPDVIHQQFATWSAVAVRSAGQLAVPLVVSLHGYDVPAVVGVERSPRGTVRRLASRGVTHKPTSYLAASNYLARKAADVGFPATRVSVLYLGVDTDFFTPAAASERRVAWAARRVCVVGRLSPEKGIDQLFRAVASLPAATRPAIDLVGDGTQRVELTALAERLRLDVTFHGLADQTQVRDRIRAASVLVLAAREYRNRQETAGLVLLEAQACGVPVVAYDSGGTNEMMAPGWAGSLVPEGDETALAAALANVLDSDGDTVLALADEAMAWVRAGRSERAAAGQLGQLYARLAAGER